MDSGLKWKTIGILATIVVGSYLLLPTFLQVPERRAAFEEAGKALPFYYRLLPEKALKLGLDLRGGIYVELEVELEEAVVRKTDILGEDLRRDLEGEEATIETIAQPQLGHLEVTFPSAADFSAFEKIHARYYRRVFAIRDVTEAADKRIAQLVLTDEYRKNLKDDVVAQATDSVRNRINRYGVGEPDIRQQGVNRIAIELPGLKDPERALQLIKRTGQLELRLIPAVNTSAAFDAQQEQLQLQVAKVRQEEKIPENDWTLETTQRINAALQKELPEGTAILFGLVRNPQTHEVIRGIPYLVEAKARVTGDMLTNAYVTVDGNEPKVAFALNKQGAKIFAEITKAHVKEFFAIILDDTVMSAPQIREPIVQGSGVITLGTGDFDSLNREARDLALILQEGALPATLTEAAKMVVGPSLGADLIAQGFRATWIAALAVVIFMLFYYRISGVIADLALVVNVILILAILTLFEATLTLPGIAGIVLTIGMAVDANVIINERIKEELRLGKPHRDAIAEGYANAKRAILDSNVTTLIAGIVLYQFGTGAIKGFAVTLCVGIVTTLLTGVVFSRVGFEWLWIRRRVARISI
ncbi:MAG: protein translocase subunit SecD [Deltaproteobacteria bacterium]|nr:protein translocase subunit SecD [Deltaproteobacteria bacterium]